MNDVATRPLPFRRTMLPMDLDEFPDPKPTWLVAETGTGKVHSWHHTQSEAAAATTNPDLYYRQVEHVNIDGIQWDSNTPKPGE